MVLNLYVICTTSIIQIVLVATGNIDITLFVNCAYSPLGRSRFALDDRCTVTVYIDILFTCKAKKIILTLTCRNEFKEGRSIRFSCKCSTIICQPNICSITMNCIIASATELIPSVCVDHGNCFSPRTSHHEEQRGQKHSKHFSHKLIS